MRVYAQAARDHAVHPRRCGIADICNGARAICWTWSPTALHTNLHWMSGSAGSSGGSIAHGNVASTAAAVFMRSSDAYESCADVRMRSSGTSGVYTLRPPGGSGLTLRAYCLLDKYGGDWIKVAQFNAGVNVMTNPAEVNPGGAWLGADINLAAGKLSTADIDAMRGNDYIVRVMGHSDPLLNSGAGTGLYSQTTQLPAWGVAGQPPAKSVYHWALDKTSETSRQVQSFIDRYGSSAANNARK